MNISHSATKSNLRRAFAVRYGDAKGLRVALAPGRVNLIGEHTDYNGGLVLPIAVDRHTAVVFQPRAQDAIEVHAWGLNHTRFVCDDRFGLRARDLRPVTDPKRRWTNYVRGVAAALAQRGVKLRGGRLLIAGDLPQGAGLSSSASLEVATGLALLKLAGRSLPPQELAFAAQEAEHCFAGVRCGIMDQTVVARAKAGHALLLDCRLMKVKHVPVRLKGWTFAVFDTGVKHALADGQYNRRRAECESAARKLKVKTLSETTIEDLLRFGNKLNRNELADARHVLTENVRTAQFAAALGQGDIETLGWLLITGFQSLASDYDVSCPELNFVAGMLFDETGPFHHDCAGARLTGGGFGGSVVALIRPKRFEHIHKQLEKAYRRQFKRRLGGAMMVNPATGAGVFAL
ncbi:MAG: galactokinase [Planctomycetes bacterium]|nr:galactokinase [Planctomycetota bacterium]